MGGRFSSGIDSPHAKVVKQAAENGFYRGTAPFFHSFPLGVAQAGLHALVVVAEGGNSQLLVSTLAAASRFQGARATITSFRIIILFEVSLLHF